jgi:uncharacterized protein YdiU (UPF0061 family)
MNTDNMSILGLTIDYGPYGWIDDFDPDWTPNTTDAQGRRYRFGQQPQIAYWNLGQLANALVPAFASTTPLEEGLQRYVEVFTRRDREDAAAKLGLLDSTDDTRELLSELHELMATAEVDMSLFFRGLADLDLAAPSLAPLEEAFYDERKRLQHAAQLEVWLRRYADRARHDGQDPARRRQRMHAVNPRHVLRNYLAQEAIDRAEQGDASGILTLLEIMRRPYDDQPGHERFAGRRPDWARHRAGCSMLSCSS